MLNGTDIKAKLYFKNIQTIDATEGSFVSSNAVFKQMALELTAKEGAQIELKSDLQKAKVRVVTGSKIILSGTALNQEVSVGTGGILRAKGFKNKSNFSGNNHWGRGRNFMQLNLLMLR